VEARQSTTSRSQKVADILVFGYHCSNILNRHAPYFPLFELAWPCPYCLHSQLYTWHFVSLVGLLWPSRHLAIEDSWPGPPGTAELAPSLN
jgi:hypothetical protein